MAKSDVFCGCVRSAFETGIIKKLVFSRPTASEIKKVSARLCSHRDKKILAFEYSLPGNTVSHRNVGSDALDTVLSELITEYSQANLITTLGDAEWRRAKRTEVALGTDALMKKMTGQTPKFELAIESLDRKKNYILGGGEDFLITLGVSDKTGRVHDKKQGKFRQINRFLEHIEAVYKNLPANKPLTVYDLCCGKSYLSFAVYYYLTKVKGREVNLLGVDLKRDVIAWCDSTARALGYTGMKFLYDDIANVPKDTAVDMVISLHACDTATDIVLSCAAELGAKVILSTPCCHRYLNNKISAKELSFVTKHPQLSGKLCEAITDAIRLSRLECYGYTVMAKELTDPDDTPKNTLITAVKGSADEEAIRLAKARYDAILNFVLGDRKSDYLKNI